MKRLIASLSVMGLLSGTLLAWGQTYFVNGQPPGSTSSATPVAVGTSTPVLVLSPQLNRVCGWTLNWAESGDLSCLPVPSATTGAGTAPTATNGFLLNQAKAPWVSTSLTDDTRLGWQCVSTNGTLNISKQEIYHCANTKAGM